MQMQLFSSYGSGETYEDYGTLEARLYDCPGDFKDDRDLAESDVYALLEADLLSFP